MTKYLKHKILGLVLIVAGFTACDTADQDVSPIVSPDSKPVATFSIDKTSAIEGDTLIITISTDKVIDRAITFTPTISGGVADENDFGIDAIVLPAYYKEVKKTVILTDDGLPELTETAQITFSVDGIAERYLLNPSQVFTPVNFSIENLPIVSEKLIVGFGWNTSDDIDMVIWTDTEVYPWQPWSDNGATSANPELDNTIWTTDPDGNYYVGILNYGVEAFNYTFYIGHPNGDAEEISGTFNSTLYTMDPWTAWGGSYNSYRLLKIVHTGETFTVTAL